MAKATTTIRESLNYQSQHADSFAANQALFNRVVAFYFEVIQAHAKACSDLIHKRSPHRPGERLPMRRSKNVRSCDATHGDCAGYPGDVSPGCHQCGAWICSCLLLLSSSRGVYAKRNTKPSLHARESRSHLPNARQSLLVHGTSRFPCTQACGKSVAAHPSCSKSGQERAGVGSRFTDFGAMSRLVT